MKSNITKRSIVIDGHKTSVSLEDAFWSGLKEIAQDQHKTLSRTWRFALQMSAFDPKRTSPWTWVQLDPRSRIWNARPRANPELRLKWLSIARGIKIEGLEGAQTQELALGFVGSSWIPTQYRTRPTFR